MDDERRISPLLIALALLVPLLLVIIVVLAVICTKLSNEKAQAEKLADEYSAAIEEQNAVQKSAARYRENYDRLVLAMLDDAALSEKSGNLIIQVWHNTIYEKQDSSTDKYTKVNGKFVDDFNDALANLFSDESFNADMETLQSNQQAIKADMKGMVNPPEGCENEYKALKDLYDSYLAFVNHVVYCEGSFNSFSEGFIKGDDDFNAAYHTAELYMK